MLEFFCNAHTHLICSAPSYLELCSALNKEQWQAQTKQIDSKNNGHIFRSFGIHPLAPDTSSLSFLETLLKQGALDAVGEAGYDLRAKGARANSALLSLQEEVWKAQLDLAIQYEKPVVIHCVKALDKIFCDAPLLKKVRAAVFHAFLGSAQDAASLLRRGINAYFSFGKALFTRGRAAECASKIPLERLLLETDNDGTKHNEMPTNDITDIKDVYTAAAAIRSMSMEYLMQTVKKNFFNALQ